MLPFQAGGSVATWFIRLLDLILDLEVPSSNLPPYHSLILFLVVPNSSPQLCCVNNQLVDLPPLDFLNRLCVI